MPLSRESSALVRAAVHLNPDGGQLLLSVLVASPRAVKYKPDDRLGPLGIMLAPPDSGRNVGSPSARPRLPAGLVGAADAFVTEWIQHRFTKAELAQEIEEALLQLGLRPSVRATDPPRGWSTLAATQLSQPETLDTVFPPPDVRS